MERRIRKERRIYSWRRRISLKVNKNFNLVINQLKKEKLESEKAAGINQEVRTIFKVKRLIKKIQINTIPLRIMTNLIIILTKLQT